MKGKEKSFEEWKEKKEVLNNEKKWKTAWSWKMSGLHVKAKQNERKDRKNN